MMKIKLPNGISSNAVIAKPIPQKAKRDLLYGTGLTKKLLASQEKSTASNLIAPIAPVKKNALQLGCAKPTAQMQSTLPSALMDSSIILDKDQQYAVDNMINEKCSILIGSAGTGKTTTLKALLAKMENTLAYSLNDDGEKIPSIAFCSFMGKAVQQMKRALPAKYHPLCNTIHSTLGFKPVMVEYINEDGEPDTKMQFLPEFNEFNKLSFDCIMVDETGTLSVALWHYLLAALKPSCRIIFLGDLNQLTPVAGHSILGFAGLSWPTFELTVLHRNAGVIAENAHRVINGFLPLTDKNNSKIVCKTMSDGSIGARKELLGIIKYLHENDKFDPMQDAIIVPQNIDILGQEQLNEVLVNQFNPDAKRIAIKVNSTIKVFAIGDKVMLLKNNNELGLTNGMQGVITDITVNNAFQGDHVKAQNEFANVTIDLNAFDNMEHELAPTIINPDEVTPEKERAGSHIVTVQFQDQKTTTTFATVGQLQDITLSYVFTCHKAQGSEYRFVVVLCHSAQKRMLSREWLYTAMTRAKTNLLILSNKRGLAHAVGTQRIKGISIKEKLQKFIELTKNGNDEKAAIIPEPESIISNARIQFK